MAKPLLLSLTLVACQGQPSQVINNEEQKVCIQMIVCGKDGKYYSTPCEAEAKGVEIDFTNQSCEQNQRNGEMGTENQ